MANSEEILGILRAINFGQRVAEEETEQLEAYFVETDQWRQLYDGHVDVVYGPKGSGKSALYSLLKAHQAELFEEGILLATAEKPRGNPVFHNLVSDPPLTEPEFVGLWKLYLLAIIANVLFEADVDNQYSRKVFRELQEAGVWEPKRSLSSILADVRDYVRRLFQPKAVEATYEIDPVSGMPSGITGRIVFGEPAAEGRRLGHVSVDALLDSANNAIEGEYSIWILLDRLDVAFADTPELERNALRALFRVYLDLAGFESIFLKIFLRTDIWEKITQDGFREASHITRHTTISWTSNELLNLVVRRALHNKEIRDYLGVEEEVVLGQIHLQRDVFYRLFPDQVDLGPNKPNTFDWCLSRTKDGHGINAPRELIHLFSEARSVQAKKVEIGESLSEEGKIFSRATFKEALPEVSRTRLEQTLYAEHPSVRPLVESLRGAKTEQTTVSLAEIWRCTPQESLRNAESLLNIGFFEARGSSSNIRFWVPFIYRDALDLVQGGASTN